MVVRKVDFDKGVEALKKVDLDSLKALKEILVLHDESSAYNEDQLLNLEYGFLKAPNATNALDAKAGSPVIANCAIAGGDDIEYPDGMPGILLMHFRAKELYEKNDNNDRRPTCGTPMMSFADEERTYMFGDKGYRYGACDKCTYGKYDPEALIKCLPNFKILFLTVYPEADGSLQPILVQFKGAGTRATPLKVEITKMVGETKGKLLEYVIKLGSRPETEKSPDGTKIIVYKYTMATAGRLDVQPERKELLRDLKNNVLKYYGAQHIMRTHLYAQLAPPEGLIGSTPVDAIEDKTGEKEAEQDDGKTGSDESPLL